MKITKFSMPISAITLSIVAFFIQQGCGEEEPSAERSGIHHRTIRDDEHRNLKQDAAVVSSSLSMILSDELTGLSIGGSLSHLKVMEVNETIDSKSSTKETDSKSSKKSKASFPSLSPTVSSQSPSSGPSVSPSQSPSSGPSVSPSQSSGPSPCPGFCRRRLEEGELPVQEVVPLESRLSIIESMEHVGAKRDATFSFEYDLISKTSCDSLIQYMDTSLQSDVESRVELPVGSSSQGAEDSYESWIPFEGGTENQYNKKLYADELVALIGKEESMKIIDFFEKSLNGLTIDCMYLARHGESTSLYTVPWHKDDYATMEITLNDNYDGGHVLHLNEAGVYKTEARPGSVTAHTDDIVHGITPNTNGAKYMLILKHHFNRPNKVGVVRLSKQMVNALVDGE